MASGEHDFGFVFDPNVAPWKCNHCDLVRPAGSEKCPRCGRVGVTTSASVQMAPEAGLRGVAAAVSSASGTLRPTAGLHGIATAFASATGTIGASLGQLNSELLLSIDLLNSLPPIDIKAGIVIAGANVKDGQLVELVAVPWFYIINSFHKDPDAIYSVSPRQWEELIAGAYKAAGFDEVVLTPRSGDFGRDVIATKNGVGSIRIFDQVKAYKPGHVVTAEEVAALLGTITGAQNVSKGVVTTTSTFAPRLMDNPFLAANIPHRLELKPRDVLLPWLLSLAKR
jgi:restriction system protein